MGYALGLDPNEPMAPQLPVPSAADGKLSITAPRSAQGVTYFFETSTDLQDWTTSGVTLTSGSPTQASVPLTDGPRFLRVRVTK